MDVIRREKIERQRELALQRQKQKHLHQITRVSASKMGYSDLNKQMDYDLEMMINSSRGRRKDGIDGPQSYNSSNPDELDDFSSLKLNKPSLNIEFEGDTTKTENNSEINLSKESNKAASRPIIVPKMQPFLLSYGDKDANAISYNDEDFDYDGQNSYKRVKPEDTIEDKSCLNQESIDEFNVEESEVYEKQKNPDVKEAFLQSYSHNTNLSVSSDTSVEKVFEEKKEEKPVKMKKLEPEISETEKGDSGKNAVVKPKNKAIRKKHHDADSKISSKALLCTKVDFKEKISKTVDEKKDSKAKLDQMMRLLSENLDVFALTSAPLGETFKCRITRDKKGVDKGFYPTYYLHLEHDDKKIFILAARQQKRASKSCYVITCDPMHLVKNSNSYVGKLKSNFLGTNYVVYGNGQSMNNSKDDENDHLRSEMASVIYDTNVLGFKGPRKMTIILPKMYSNSNRVRFQPTNKSETLLETYKRNEFSDILQLMNKTPVWNDDSQSYVLNFHGRVSQASVKNFQLVHSSDTDYIVMQFGRVANDEFSMDFAYPLCALQAFGIALSSFDGKLACE